MGEISLLPRRLTDAFLNMYRATKQAMEAVLNATPPPPPDQVTFLQGEIAYIDQQISLLQQFQQSLTGFENMLRSRP